MKCFNLKVRPDPFTLAPIFHKPMFISSMGRPNRKKPIDTKRALQGVFYYQ